MPTHRLPAPHPHTRFHGIRWPTNAGLRVSLIPIISVTLPFANFAWYLRHDVTLDGIAVFLLNFR